MGKNRKHTKNGFKWPGIIIKRKAHFPKKEDVDVFKALTTLLHCPRIYMSNLPTDHFTFIVKVCPRKVSIIQATLKGVPFPFPIFLGGFLNRSDGKEKKF